MIEIYLGFYSIVWNVFHLTIKYSKKIIKWTRTVLTKAEHNVLHENNKHSDFRKEFKYEWKRNVL